MAADPLPVDPRLRFKRAWRQYRRRSRFVSLMAVASLTLVALALLTSGAKLHHAAAITGLVVAIAVAGQANLRSRFDCPRCGKRFFGAGLLAAARARACVHCQLPKWSDGP
jgi:hypothetical protein